jgi:hypothetical protein
VDGQPLRCSNKSRAAKERKAVTIVVKRVCMEQGIGLERWFLCHTPFHPSYLARHTCTSLLTTSTVYFFISRRTHQSRCSQTCTLPYCGCRSNIISKGQPSCFCFIKKPPRMMKSFTRRITMFPFLKIFITATRNSLFHFS